MSVPFQLGVKGNTEVLVGLEIGDCIRGWLPFQLEELMMRSGVVDGIESGEVHYSEFSNLKG